MLIFGPPDPSFSTPCCLSSSFSREYKFLPSPFQSCCHVRSDSMIYLGATTDIRSHHTASDTNSQSSFMPPLLLFYTVSIYLVSHQDMWPKLIAKGFICGLLNWTSKRETRWVQQAANQTLRHHQKSPSGCLLENQLKESKINFPVEITPYAQAAYKVSRKSMRGRGGIACLNSVSVCLCVWVNEQETSCGPFRAGYI